MSQNSLLHLQLVDVLKWWYTCISVIISIAGFQTIIVYVLAWCLHVITWRHDVTKITAWRQEFEFKWVLRIFVFILLALFISLARLSSLSFSPDRVFRRRRSAIIARPLGWPQTTTRRNISTFLSFFRHFHRGNCTHQTWTRIFPNSFPTFSFTTWPPLGKQMATLVSHWTSILLPPPNSVQSLHSTAPNHRGSRS